MEHLLNCHGEITALFSFLSSLPMVGMFVRCLRARCSAHPHEESPS